MARPLPTGYKEVAAAAVPRVPAERGRYMRYRRFAPSLALRSAALAGLALLAGSSDAPASGERPATTRFDERVRLREGGVIAIAPVELDQLAPAGALRRQWETFRERHGGGWRVHLDERTAIPALASGRGIELFPSGAAARATLDDLERQLENFVAANGILPPQELARARLDPQASSIGSGGRAVAVFGQWIDGVRVENARMDFHLVDGKLVMFGSSNWGEVRISGLPSLDANDARRILDEYLGAGASDLEPARDPELVLIAVDPDPAAGPPQRWRGQPGKGLAHVLVWRWTLRNGSEPALWVAEIDALDGSVRAFYDGAHYVAVRGGVYPVSPNVGCSSGGCELDGFPMPFADWKEPGQSASVTDAYGNLSCGDPAATFETRLAGPYAVVQDECGPFLATGDCGTGLQLGVKSGENCDVAPGASPGNTAAARTAYYHVNRVNEVARSYISGLDWLHRQIAIHSNWDAVCNASYGADALYLYRSGTSSASCANTGEIEGIVVHEWGHGLDANDGGGYDNTSEAYGDLVSMLASRQSCFGPGLFTDGRVCSGYGDTCLSCTGFRDHDWAARQANTPATPQGFVQTHCSPGSGPCGYGVHCETYPIVEAMFDLATRDLPASGMDLDSAWQLVERLWYTTRPGSGGAIYTCALPASDSCAASSWYQRLRSADDDDANLANGTPHAAALYAAFARHNIACGSAADPDNQSTSGCPVLARPELQIEESGTGPQLHWFPVTGASWYVVYRGDLGCAHQQVAIANLAPDVTSFIDDLPDPGLPRSYRIEAVAANATCRSPISNCEVAGGGPRLQRNSHRMIEDAVNSNGNGFLDPGETAQLPVTLFNGGTADALGVSGRLRTVDPVQGRVIGPVVSYPDLGVGEAIESGDPHFRLTLFETGAVCGRAVPLEVEMHAENATPRVSRFDLVLGDRQRDFPNHTSISLPRKPVTPVTSTVTIDQEQTVEEVDVSVWISHGNAAELIVELTSPHGTTVRLHDHTPSEGGINTRYDLLTAPSGPGTMADFVGEPTQDTWTLAVQDTIFGGPPGTLTGFELHVTVTGGFDCSVWNCAEPIPTDSPTGLLVEKTVNGGSGSVDLHFSWTGTAAAGYHLLESPGPTFDAQVDLIGRTEGATNLTTESVVTGTPGMTYYQVRSVNACSQESP